MVLDSNNLGSNTQISKSLNEFYVHFPQKQEKFDQSDFFGSRFEEQMIAKKNNMNTIIKNFLFTLNRFKTSSILNLLGLSVAFAAFILIMMQIRYDNNYDNCYSDNEQLYKVIIGDSVKSAYFSRPVADILLESSPHIIAGTIVDSRSGLYNKYLINVAGKEEQTGFLEYYLTTYPNFPEVFGLEMLEGDRDAMSVNGMAIIPESLAVKLFGNEPALDKQIIVGPWTNTIKGVYKDFPANSSLTNDIYANMGMSNHSNWNTQCYYTFVRIDHPNFISEIKESFKKNLPEDFRKQIAEGEAPIEFVSLNDLHFRNDIRYENAPKISRESVFVLWTIAFSILIIAFINFINFSISMAPKRVRIINTQIILGAYKERIRFSILIEAFFMSVISFLFALVIIYVLSKTSVSNLIDGGIDLFASSSIVVTSAFVALSIGAISGIYPAYYTTSFSPALVIRGNIGSTPRGQVLRNLLIGIQFTASFVLIISIFLMNSQYDYLKNMSLGYDRDEIMVINTSPKIKQEMKAFTNELNTLAGIEGVGFSETLIGGDDLHMGWGREYEGRNVSFNIIPVTPDMLKIMNIEVLEGRNFREDDTLNPNGKYIFNQKAKKEFDLKLNTFLADQEIIGFMPDIQFQNFYSPPEPMCFFVWGTNNWGNRFANAYVKITAGSDMYAIRNHIKKILSNFDPGFPFEIVFLNDALEKTYQKDKRVTELITLFSIVTILISIMGVFGLVLFETEYRRKEIAIRKVTGSTIEEILTLFNKSYLLILGICFVIACPIVYFAMSRWLENFASRTTLSWWIFAAGGLVVLIITVITILSQCYKAATENPAEVLMSE